MAKYVFDISDPKYGDPAKLVTNCAPALRWALADAANAMKKDPFWVRPEVHIPRGKFCLSEPVFVPDGVDVRGEGWCSHLVGIFQNPVLVVGLPDPGLVPENRPDLFGVLDATAVPSPGSRYGLALGNDICVQFQHLDISNGPWSYSSGGFDYWGRTNRMTISTCLLPNDFGSWAPWSPIMGMGRGDGIVYASPWTMTFGDSVDKIRVNFSDDLHDRESVSTNHYMELSVAAFSPPYKLAFQINLETLRFSGFVNGVQVPVTVRLTPNTPPGRFFRYNEIYPFFIGTAGYTAQGARATPLTCAGLNITASERYVVGNPGDVQQRADLPGVPVTDLYRFFDRGDSTIAYLPMNAPDGRTVRVINKFTGTGCGFWVKRVQAGGYPNAIENLRISCNGTCILLAAVLDTTINYVKAHSPINAIASLNVMANYPIKVSNCTLGGQDCAYHGFAQIAWITDCTVAQLGWDAFRFVGCDATVSNAMLAFGTPFTKRIFSCLPYEYGGSYRFTSILDDSEGRHVDRAFVEVWPTAYSATQVVMDQVYAADVGNKPFVKLHDKPIDSSTYRFVSTVDVKNVFANNVSSLVEVDGPNWVGGVWAPQTLAQPVNYLGPQGTATGVVSKTCP